MGEELKWLLKEEGGLVVGLLSRTVVFLLKICLPHTYSLALFPGPSANGVCLHLLVPPLAQCCFFETACGWGCYRVGGRAV